MRLATASADKEAAVEASLAYIRHTTELEKAETQGASFWECFKGTNLRRTEIVCPMPSKLTDKTNQSELRRLGSPDSLR